MNFGKVIKQEILGKIPKSKCCKKAFLSGLIRGSGSLYIKDGELALDFSVSDEDLAYVVSSLFESLYSYQMRELSVMEDRLNKKDRFVMSIIGDEATDILLDLGILIENDEDVSVNFRLFSSVTEKECCMKSFLKGLFISSGSCTVPGFNEKGKTGYHLELAFTHTAPASEMVGKLLEYGIEAKATRRKESIVVYVKNSESIKNFIALIGAPVSVLKLTDLIINKELANNSNRQANCDLGNVSRQIEASEKQLSAINKIKKTCGLESLKKDLNETAIARINNPEETLQELADRLNITKSCLNHRLRKIVQIAEQLK